MNDNLNPQTPVSRRDFLKTTSTAVGGVSLLGGLSIERSAFPAGDETLKVALIGCGGRGSGAAKQALSTNGSVMLVAMADVFKDRMDGSLKSLEAELKDSFKEKVQVPEENKFIGFDAYKQATALADVVILATPPGFRPMQFEEAVRQGKNVFTEKPVATDAPGVRRFLAAAQEAKRKNLKVGVGLQRHHQDGYLETLKRLHDGAIGDIVATRAYWNGSTPWVKPRKELEKQYGRPLTEIEYQMRNWYYFVWLCGDHICEQHIHNLDVINWIKNGHPVKARGNGGCETRKGKDYGEIFDHHVVEFEYADGSVCFSQCRHQLGCWNEVSEYAIGTKGKCDVSGYSMKFFNGDSSWRFKKEGAKDPYQQEHDDLFDAIRNNKPYNEAEYGAHSTMTSILGRMATYSGKVIDWDDAIKSDINYFPERLAWDANPKSMPNADGYYQLPVPGSTNVV